MRSQRTIAIIAFICLFMVLPGCEREQIKNYFYDFVKEKDFERYDGEWTTSSDGYFFDEGLFLLDTWAAIPYMAYGTMLMCLKFEVTPDYIGSGKLDAYFYSMNPQNGSTIRVGILIEKLGGTDAEYSTYYQLEGCEPVFGCKGLDLQHLHAGVNILSYDIFGKELSYRVNGFYMGEPFEIPGLTGWLRPYIHANSNLIRFESLQASTTDELIRSSL